TTLTVLEPATEGVLAEVPKAGAEEADAAIARAKAAFPGWRSIAPAERAAMLRRIGVAIADRAEELSRLEARNVGKPIADARGKSANVIYADADLEAAAASAPIAVFGNAGQDCCARSRILVERSALDRFMELLERSVDALRVGDPLDPDTEMGPLISAGQRET